MVVYSLHITEGLSMQHGLIISYKFTRRNTYWKISNKCLVSNSRWSL